jgi:hypothetical protein
MYDGIDTDMITEYVGDVLLKYCLYCKGRCWEIDGYPYACRCSDCSAYFHRRFLTCDDLEYEGYDTHLCAKYHGTSALRIFTIADGRLVEVCQSCAEWLCEEGYIEKELEVTDGEYDDNNAFNCFV